MMTKKMRYCIVYIFEDKKWAVKSCPKLNRAIQTYGCAVQESKWIFVVGGFDRASRSEIVKLILGAF